MKPKQKSVLIVDDSRRSQPIDLCRELCQKLNLSDVHQVNEIVQILASNAPHILKQDPLAARPPTSDQGLFDLVRSYSKAIFEQNHIKVSVNICYCIHPLNPND